MTFSPADARFLFARASGLVRRGLASLRTRGWKATWERISAHFGLWQPARRGAVLLSAPAPGSGTFAVPASAAPLASIVIPVYDHVETTLRCLRALAAWPPAVACEVIVVDDGSTDRSAELLPGVQGLVYHRHAANGGYVDACNDGARLARGEFVVFLNNDTVPQPGWLDALLATFREHHDVGLVGARLLYPDGRLQEAGGVVLANGQCESYGRFSDPGHCAYAYLRETDYCSGAALAVPKRLFDALGGFDCRYAPAYYEDTDLAFAVRAAGLRVLYQPAARVVHDEGTTAGTDTASGTKAFQVRNRARFAEKWRAALAAQPPAGTIPSPRTLHRDRPQVLVIDALTPAIDRDSGSLRLVNLMRLLRQEGAHVVFLPANRTHAGTATETLQQLGIEAWYAPHARRAPAWLREHGPHFDTVMVCRHYVAAEFLPLLRRHAPQARIVFDSVDLHYLRERRAAELAGDPALLRAAARTRRNELDVVSRADLTLVVSESERELLARDAPGRPVEVLSNLHELAERVAGYGQRRDLLFVGGFRHPPNVDAVRWFVDEVLPLVRSRLPDVAFHCIGADVPDAIRALSTRDGVVLHGHVPDLLPHLDGARIALAPLRYGAGVKGKVNLSMAHGQPVVATTCAVEGMHLRDGHDVLVADTPHDFADAVVRLYRDPELWQRLSANGRDNVATHFSAQAARATVRRVFLPATA